ncbi:lysis system i-spanin subunit Rz [Comamonas aquatica]|uniref:lysis system i-spanin subunit Rz n=1 Tax=Comamonas aquatica TaxID=225991 RepID=UPI001EF3A2C7|nr:lysis system i-spanin subunit Rz [Comamonas aquatica]
MLAAVGAAMVFGAGWVANGWRLDDQLAERDRQALAVAEQVMAIGRAANAAISTADAKAWKGLEDDKKELRRLRGCVADGTCGVRLITAEDRHGPSNPGAGSVGHDTVELDPDVQRRVLDHREAIGEDARKLEYLQEFASQCWRAINGDDGPSR